MNGQDILKRYAALVSATVLFGLLASDVTADLVQLREAADKFSASLSAVQQSAAVFPLKSDVRATWSNLPTLLVAPAGILLKSLDDEQRALVHDMLRNSLSSQGYSKAFGIMLLDDLLHEIETTRLESTPADQRNPLATAMAANRDSGNYAVALFGDPTGGDWGWKITGHHLALNFTVAGDRLGFLPVFLGSNPRRIDSGPYSGWMPLSNEAVLGLTLMQTLNAAQQSKARLAAEVPQDVFTGPGRRTSLAAYEGLPAAALSPDQLPLLQNLVREYVGNASGPAAGLQLDTINQAGWDKLWFSWRGDQNGRGRFYYRVHGPRILIEYNLQDPNHDHAVVRDPLNDYGEDWLGHHYTEAHPTLEQALKDVQQRLGVSDG